MSSRYLLICGLCNSPWIGTYHDVAQPICDECLQRYFDWMNTWLALNS